LIIIGFIIIHVNQSKQWIKRDEMAPKKAKTVLSTEKVKVSVFWNAKKILLIDYLEKKKTVTDQYYKVLLKKLKAAITKKRHEKTS